MVSACDSNSLVLDKDYSERVHNQIDTSLLRFQAAMPTTNIDGNLLVNGSFENQFKDGWNSCGDQQKIKYSHQATDGGSALELAQHGCIYQGAKITPNATVSLACDASIASNKNDWTGLGVSFYDDSWNYIDDAAYAVVSNNKYQVYEVTEQAPSSAVYASVWFYTENTALLDNCFLTTEQTDTENLLYNPDFSITRNGDIRGYPVTQADGWRDACGAVNQRTSSGPMVLAEGACVHQRLSNDAIRALQGNYFEFTCTYNLTRDHYATLSTNLTDRRRDTGMNEVLVLTKTSTNEAFLYGTATLSGKASDNLSSAPGIFVAITKQSNGMMFVKDCSLRVVDGPTSK